MSAKPRPNFLFIITDQQRADHVGCYGNEIVKTPAIDSLAKRGLRFDNLFVATPVCMPNRASIMTGRMPSLHGGRHNGIPLARDHVTFVELLRDAGYRTALIGKSHLQSVTGIPSPQRFASRDGYRAPSEKLQDAYKNNRSGADYELENMKRWDTPLAGRTSADFYGFTDIEIVADHADAAGGDYLLWARDRHSNFDQLVGQKNALADDRIHAPQCWRTAVPEELYSTTYVKERTLAALDRYSKDQSQPFFIQMSFPDPHHPFTPPGRYWDMYDPAAIPLPTSFGQCDLPPVMAMREAMLSGADKRDNQSPFAVTEDEVKQITALTYGSISMIDDAIGEVLKRLRALGIADNTVIVFTSDHGDYMGDHGIMLKMLLHFRGIIRVPFIWSEAGCSSQVDSTLGSSIDIPVTILRRAGIEPFNGMQGRDLLEASGIVPDSVIVEEDNNRPKIGFPHPQRIRTIVTQTCRMSVRLGEDWGELYDLEADPHEIHNLWNDPASRPMKSAMFEKLAMRLIELQDRSPLPVYIA